MFFIPLYTYIGCSTLLWIWSLILYSDKCPDHWMFNTAQPKTTQNTIAMFGVIGFFNALAGIAGHELVH